MRHQPRVRIQPTAVRRRSSLDRRPRAADVLAEGCLFLARRLDGPVVDETGVTDSFDFTLEWSNAAMRAEPGRAAPDGPTLFTALPEQLGVRLEARKLPIDVLVVDRVERPTEN